MARCVNGGRDQTSGFRDRRPNDSSARYVLNAAHIQLTDFGKTDYEGVTLSSRTANSKAAASAISAIFQNHYPEFLVRVPRRHFPVPM
jgi:hypothetical protein